MKRLAVLGQPIAHSRSPAIHGAALAELGLAGKWSYEAIEVAPADFAELVRGLPARGFVGVNVTIPHKEAAFALADRASDVARAIGAANTLCFENDGITAHNTDAPGLIAALPLAPKGRNALVLGAGGAGRAAAWALRGAGATVSVWNRSPERAQALAAALGSEAIEGDRVELERFDLLVNCTSIGLGGAGRLDPEIGSGLKDFPFSADQINDRLVVADLVYGAAGTELVGVAEENGAVTVDGLEILVRQGALSLELWTGRSAPLTSMRQAARADNR